MKNWLAHWFPKKTAPLPKALSYGKGHRLSAYLPRDFDAHQKVVLLAGRGDYPMLLRNAMRQCGIEASLVAFEGETDPLFYESFASGDREKIPVGPVNPLLNALQNLNARYVFMVGQIAPKRLFQDLKLDFKAVRILAGLKERNAESLFGAIAQCIESLGIEVLDARAFLDRSLAEDGFMAGKNLILSPELLAHSHWISREVSRLNIGQGIVVHKGTTLAVEGFDGTDALLRRCKFFEKIDKVFFKTIKPKQDWRFDVPVFGLRTLQSMLEGGVQTAILEAEHVLMLNKPEVIEFARQNNITLYGYSPLPE